MSGFCFEILDFFFQCFIKICFEVLIVWWFIEFVVMIIMFIWVLGG